MLICMEASACVALVIHLPAHTQRRQRSNRTIVYSIYTGKMDLSVESRAIMPSRQPLATEVASEPIRCHAPPLDEFSY